MYSYNKSNVPPNIAISREKKTRANALFSAGPPPPFREPQLPALVSLTPHRICLP